MASSVDEEGLSSVGSKTIQLFLNYNTKERNTTIGMPELMEVQLAKEKAAARATRNRNSTAHQRNISNGSTVPSWDDSPPGRKTGNRVSFADAIVTPESAKSASIMSTPDSPTQMHFRDSQEEWINSQTQRRISSEEEERFNELVAKGMLPKGFAMMPERERLYLSEDVYAFVFACPICSAPFWFAMYFIVTKYTIFWCMLLNSLTRDGEYRGPSQWTVQAVKFLLIPVAIAMQEDLMTAYYNCANKIYDRTVTKGSTQFRHATFKKWVLSNFLRCLDGLLSLAVCFSIMLITNTVLGVFLNFAALHFLQGIDDIFYELSQRGFFFDAMEDATQLCKQITFSRRYTMHVRSETATDCDGKHHKNNDDDGNTCDSNGKASWNNFLMEVDTYLLFFTIFVCVVIYGFIQWFIYSPYQDHNKYPLSMKDIEKLEQELAAGLKDNVTLAEALTLSNVTDAADHADLLESNITLVEALGAPDLNDTTLGI